jgi:MFS transporter, DHA3 family, tetracycline resistance protein
MPDPRKALKIYLAYSTLTAGLYQMVFTVSLLYFVTTAKLDPLQMVLVGTALETAIFLFEIPTGVVADTYSRRLSVLIGTFLIGLAFIVEGSFPLFLPLLFSQVLWGVGYTFTSGALQAWVSDEAGEEAANPAFVRAAQLEQIGALAGIGLAVLLGGIHLSLPIVTGGALFLVLGLALIPLMPEDGFQPTPAADRSTWQHLRGTLQGGMGMLRLRPALAGILLIGLFFGLYSEGYDRLWTPFLLGRFQFPTWAGMTQVTWFGAIDAIGMLLTAAATEILQRRVNLRQTRAVSTAMGACSLVLVACLFAFPFSEALPTALALIWSISMLRQMAGPLYTAWVNHRLDPRSRATILSMSSQVDALGQIGGGPLVGVIAQSVGIPAGLFASAALLAPVLLLFGWQFRNQEKQET